MSEAQTELEVIGTLNMHLLDHTLGGNEHLPWVKVMSACDQVVPREQAVTRAETSANPHQLTCRRCRDAWVTEQLTGSYT